jgi:hypothetical protein
MDVIAVVVVVGSFIDFGSGLIETMFGASCDPEDRYYGLPPA